MSYPVKDIRIPLLPTSNNPCISQNRILKISYSYPFLMIYNEFAFTEDENRQKFLVCLLTDGALLLKMYCQRDKALGNSSLDPTSHPSQPMHSHSATFTLAFRLSPHTESQDCFRLCHSPLPLSLSFVLSSLPPAHSALAVADTLQSQTLALASTCSLHQNQQITDSRSSRIQSRNEKAKTRH